MIRVRASAFATSVATRYAAASPSRRRVGRVLVQLGRRAGAPARGRAAPARLTLRLTHRLITQERTSVRLTRALTLVQRVERHLLATRHVVERTQRVEQVALRPGTLPQLLPAAHPRAAAQPVATIVVPALPRVLRRPAPPVPAAEPAHVNESADMRRQRAPAQPPIDVARLTDEVMRGIDKRLAAWRERRGRV